MTEKSRINSIKLASWISISGNAFLAILKLVAGILTGSLSVLGDGIDSTGDVLTSVITLFIATLISRPPNIKFPYGYAKAETNATNALSFIILFAGAQLAITSVKKLVTGNITETPDNMAIIVIIVSILGKMALAWHQRYLGNKTHSTMLLANAKNMQSDVLISVAVLVGLLSSNLLKMPILDPIAALLVAFWIIWVAIRIFFETNIELMDGHVEKEVYAQVFNIVEEIPGAENPHRMRIRKIGHRKMINIDIEVNGQLPIIEAHRISHEVEDKIKSTIENVFDVAIHIEPHDEHIEEKDLGISKEALQ